jgi:hypothetical protein
MSARSLVPAADRPVVCISQARMGSTRLPGKVLLYADKETASIRDAVGVSRKHAVPLVDYLDKIRFTVRSGHARTPGVEARKLLK